MGNACEGKQNDEGDFNSHFSYSQSKNIKLPLNTTLLTNLNMITASNSNNTCRLFRPFPTANNYRSG